MARSSEEKINHSPEDGSRTNSRNVVYMNYTSDNGQCPTQCSFCVVWLEFALAIYFCRSCGSSGSTVSDYGLNDRGSIPDRGRGFFF
jgi:hypothetical protein